RASLLWLFADDGRGNLAIVTPYVVNAHEVIRRLVLAVLLTFGIATGTERHAAHATVCTACATAAEPTASHLFRRHHGAVRTGTTGATLTGPAAVVPLAAGTTRAATAT